ncbi:hypothetical protein [Alistipes putredinis]|jgi:hypothetical protein|uniref:hypothetical protein n=1 Tax=Alistipes putredinis TaxID=28117 RepID=UPI0020495498|nr:MAG TPA: hypothetical protein [Caudoviricetes sp.]
MKALLNWRYYVLTVVGIIAVIGTFSVPIDDQPFGAWLFIMVASKVIGFGSWYLIFRMSEYWDARGLIPEMSKMMQEEDETWE